jgi:hypothetical protein
MLKVDATAESCLHGQQRKHQYRASLRSAFSAVSQQIQSKQENLEIVLPS